MEHAPAPSTSRPLPTRQPFYYGWVMLPVTVVGTLALCPGQSFGIGEFKGVLRLDLDLTETRLSVVYGVATFIAGLTAMLAGAAMDRFGLRRAITVTVILMGASCLFASRVQGMISLFFAFTLLRVFGHSALPLMVGNTLAMWFRRRLGFVTGMVGVSIAVATAGIPALYLWLINTFGWRNAWIVLGIGTWVLLLPIMAFVFRNRPSDVGQHVDGAATDRNPCESATTLQTVGRSSFDLRSARRTRAYWCLLALSGAHGLVFAAVMFHRVQIFEANQVTARSGVAIIALLFTCSAVAQFLAGLIADRVPLHLILFVSSAAATAGMLVLAQVDGLAGGYAFCCLYGLSVGAEVVGRNTAWPIYFGTRNLGKIKGSAAMVTVISSSIGPLIVGASYDYLGSYDPAVWSLAGVYGLITMAMLFAAQPCRA